MSPYFVNTFCQYWGASQKPNKSLAGPCSQVSQPNLRYDLTTWDAAAIWDHQGCDYFKYKVVTHKGN